MQVYTPDTSMRPLHRGLENNLVSLTFALMVVLLWLLMHGYQGLGGDAQIYAFQAMARIHPALATDLYLQNTSQDQFTIFSPFYAAFISAFGLEDSARWLMLFFTLWLLAAAWSVAAAITGRNTAWLAVAAVIIVAGDYGGAGVFRLTENYLTARLPAEALIVTAFACHVGGRKKLAWLIALTALLVHPLMALPGLIVLICLDLRPRVATFGAAAGIVFAVGIGVTSQSLPAVAHVVPVMDRQWLEVVRERSQFLFPELWTWRDWGINLLPLALLTFIGLATENHLIRKLCVASLLTGACGLAVALIAGLIGPAAILIQGQAWRWIWPACLCSVLLLPYTVLRVWGDKKCGPLLTILLICAGFIPPIAATVCVLVALSLWLLRARVEGRAILYLRWIALAVGIAALAWMEKDSWSGLSSAWASVSRHSGAIHQIGDVLGVKVLVAVLFGLCWWLLNRSRNLWMPACASAGLLVACLGVLPAAFSQSRYLGSDSDTREFTDWSDAIPPGSTVLVAPPRDVGAFVWFTLGRPNYLALDQSAGVVFSRKTALEIRRRSEVLLPLTDPTWKILSGIRRSAAKIKPAAPTRPLTTAILIEVCQDSDLGFVISPENVGFDPLPHAHDGPWKAWNLYDCRHVRSQFPTA
jgi:hypothetical protein